jgi:hypothetical protein
MICGQQLHSNKFFEYFVMRTTPNCRVGYSGRIIFGRTLEYLRQQYLSSTGTVVPADSGTADAGTVGWAPASARPVKYIRMNNKVEVLVLNLAASSKSLKGLEDSTQIRPGLEMDFVDSRDRFEILQIVFFADWKILVQVRKSCCTAWRQINRVFCGFANLANLAVRYPRIVEILWKP